jgi:tRNA uridine 5-carboxymethylaminomethyl modification enzyme
MQARLERMKNVPKEQILRAKLLQLKMKMEDYLKNPVYDNQNHFAQFLEFYVDTIYSKRIDFAKDINVTPNFLSKIINSHREPKEEFILKRDQAYIGVLIDDLINKGTDEPYRMFTSRAEFRTLLRQDNADIRLTPLSNAIGLASNDRWKAVEEKNKVVADIRETFADYAVSPAVINEWLQTQDTAELNETVKAQKILLRPNISMPDLLGQLPELKDKVGDVPRETLEQAEIQIKYQSYIEREKEISKKMMSLDELKIPDNFDYTKLVALSNEAKQKFIKIKPATLGQASRISGVNPSDVQILMVYMGR